MRHNRPRQTNDTYLVLNVTFREKCLSLAYSGTAGSVAAIASKETMAFGVKALSLGWLFPEFTAAVVGAIAFSHTAAACCNEWNARIRPQDLVLREMRKPRIDIS